MRPAEQRQPGIILDSYTELDLLHTALNNVWGWVPEGLISEVEDLIPDIDKTMGQHEEVLPLARQAGSVEPAVYFYLSAREVACSALILTILITDTDREEVPFQVRAVQEMIDEMAANLTQSRALGRIGMESEAEKKDTG